MSGGDLPHLDTIGNSVRLDVVSEKRQRGRRGLDADDIGSENAGKEDRVVAYRCPNVDDDIMVTILECQRGQEVVFVESRRTPNLIQLVIPGGTGEAEFPQFGAREPGSNDDFFDLGTDTAEFRGVVRVRQMAV